MSAQYSVERNQKISDTWKRKLADGYIWPRLNGKLMKCPKCGKEKYRSLSKQKHIHCSRRCGAIGSRNSPETRAKLSKIAITTKRIPPPRTGIRPWNWRGVTPENIKIRKSPAYKEWRRKVFARDNYKCIACGNGKEVCGELNADHIKP